MSDRAFAVLWLGLLAWSCAPSRQPGDEAALPPAAGPHGTGSSSPQPDDERDRPVTKEDVQILERAMATLSEESRWNRKDNRECPPAAVRWSLYCALHDASLHVLGTYDHRRVALQEVRFAIEEVAQDQAFQHRLMDFNNLPSTSLADIRTVLEIARRRVAERLRQREPAPGH